MMLAEKSADIISLEKGVFKNNGTKTEQRKREITENQPVKPLVCRGDRTRTCDSLVPNQERYQLRYTSILRVQRYTFSATLANFSAIIL